MTSNAGYPMLVVDRYTFHRHSSNPKTGRTNWRCSRRRVKDIRCASSCHSVDDMASAPTVHDPNCLPLTNAELMAYEIRREKLNISAFNLQDPSSNIIDEENLSNGFNFTTDSFQNREVASDEEELNDVLHDLNENVMKEENNQSPEPQNLTDNDYNKRDSGYINDESLDSSSIQDSTIEANTNNTISAIIESNKKLLSNINNNKSFGRHQNQHINKSPIKLTNSATTLLTLDPIASTLAHNNQSKSIYFVTSKVGHPMLVVDQYTFHKHSMNPKTGRINWRCARRRVKEIRCSSSCYTVDGVVSNPTHHDPKCYPLTEELLKTYQNKRAKLVANNSISTKLETFTNFKTINMKAESYTTLKAKAMNNLNNIKQLQYNDSNGDNEFENNNNTNNSNNNTKFEEFNNLNDLSDMNDMSDQIYEERQSPVPKFQQMYRNKRKDNMPTRSNENSDEYNSDNLPMTHLIDDPDHENEDNDVINQTDEENYYETEDLGYNEEPLNYNEHQIEVGEQHLEDNEDGEQQNRVNSEMESYVDVMNNQNGHVNGHDHDDLGKVVSGASNEYLDESSYSSSPQSLSRIVSDLNEMKRKEKVYSEKLRNANSEINRIKRVTSKQIQSLHWKSKMMEIDMSSLKSNIHQKNMENQNLKQLLDDMMTKLKSDFK